MPEFTTNQWGILFLVLVLGWLLGLISRSGGKKWKRAYEAERDARIEEQRALEAANVRIAELTAAPPVVIPPVRVATPAAVHPRSLDTTRDDLSLIRGIGIAGQRRLNEGGITRYADIAAMTPADEAALERRLGADEGYIEQERWREQAALLEAGKIDEHRAAFG